MKKRHKGFILPAAVAFAVIFFIVGLSLLSVAEQEVVQTRLAVNRARAFYLAEAGLARLSETLYNPGAADEDEPVAGTTEQGTYYVDLHADETPAYAISTGASGQAQRRIRVEVAFLAPPFENCIYGLNSAGGDWVFALRGAGVPGWSNGHLIGGRDTIAGNIFVDGDARLYDESSVTAAPAPNTFNLEGDVEATGNIALSGSSSIAGDRTAFADEPDQIDLLAMDYANNNTHNVSTIFQSAGVGSGRLPSGHELRNIFNKNPGDRAAECASTSGDDYFLEPTGGFVSGTQFEALTPLNLGSDRIYYVDGDLWIHNTNTYGFNISGRVTFVVTGNIHISDNMQYADSDSLVGLISLGSYDSSGDRVSGGDIFFGDPRFGTLYSGAGLMFAAHDFLYSTDSVTNQSAEPMTGFRMFGSFAALNRVSVDRDWYTDASGTARPARFNAASGVWVDARTGTALTAGQVSTLRHYRMVVNYDERVRNAETQPPGLPRGGASIFAGFSRWQELP